MFGKNTNGALGLGNVEQKDTPTEIKGYGNIKKIVCQHENSAFITEDNQLYIMGDNFFGKNGLYYNRENPKTYYLRTPTLIPLNTITNEKILDVKISFGLSHELLLINSQLYICGSNANGCLGLDKDISSVSVFTKHEQFANQKIDDIECGYRYSTLIINKVAYVTGFNNEGQLGLGDRKNVYRFTLIPSLRDVHKIVPDANYTAFLTIPF
jgi:alpha-tubulin suppressor-like RCC1 family protein